MRGKSLWFQYHQGKKTYWKNTHSTSIKEAKRQRDSLLGEIAKGKVPPPRAEKVTFDDLAQLVTNHYKAIGLRSLWRVNISIDHLRKFFGRDLAINITTDRIMEYRIHRQGAAVATINRELAALRTAFYLAVEAKKLYDVPNFNLPKENNARKDFIEPEKAVELRKHLPPWLLLIFALSIHSGIREGEVLGLTWDKIDWEEGKIVLDPQDTKNKEHREVYLTPEIMAMLTVQKSLYPLSPWVFPSKMKKNGHISDFRVSWKKACEKAGFDKTTFHATRRSAIRDMSRSGTPEGIIMRITGHKTRSVFDRYNITSQEDIRQASQRVEKYRQDKINRENIVKMDASKTLKNGITN